MITKRSLLVATLKAKEKVNKAVEKFDSKFKQEPQNGNNQTPETPPQVPSEPVPNNGS